MEFKRAEEDDFNLELTSLIDVVFLLLIFFMVSTAFVDFTRRMDIELPESKSSTSIEKVKNYLIEMGIDGKIQLNGKDVTFIELEKRLQSTKNQKDRAVIIKADKRITHGKVVKVMGICRDAAVLDISIAVK